MTIALLFVILGLLLYTFGDRLGAKAVETGRLVFFAAILSWLLSVGSRVLLAPHS